MEDKSYHLKTSEDLDALMDFIGDSKHVFLGEASHGTHEFYTWRTAISKKLIEEKGFDFIAVEGDWPDCYKLNRFVKSYDFQNQKPEEILKTFDRWPSWMWANWEVVALLEWMKNFNKTKAANQKAGFYGLDVYSLWESMEAIVGYLEKYDPESAKLVKKALKCLEPYGEDEIKYARAQFSVSASCKDPLIKMLSEIKRKSINYNHDAEAALNTEQNAQVAVNAERYYRNMIGFNDNTWNIRDRHMMDSLHRLLKFHGSNAKSIVWAHNTHIGDAKFTNMADAGMYNIGQLAREELDKVKLIGFASHSGKVIAGKQWGAAMQEMEVPEAVEGSIEQILHDETPEDRYILFNKSQSRFARTIPHRAIGVVYDPTLESRGNYVPSFLSSRYDALIYMDQTQALHPLIMNTEDIKVPETYPFKY